MWRRYLVALLFVGATFFLGCFPGGAVAQEGRSTYSSLMGQSAGPEDLAALFSRPAVPVQLYELDGPDSLIVGEEGLFKASANLDAASLPLRLRWDFGDGTTASGLHTRHRFTAPGTYSVAFTLSNDYGEVTDELTVTVTPQETSRAVSDRTSPRSF